MKTIPEVVTHNYDPMRGPGRNICNLPKDKAETVLESIRAGGIRHISANYLKRRHDIEDWLMSERQRKLGKTPLLRPAYFFLGNYADGNDLSRPASLVIPLSAFHQDSLTFTYSDSMESLPIATKSKYLKYRKPYHGQVFTLPEIKAVVAKHGMPAEGWPNGSATEYDQFIEMQVWDDQPIKKWLEAA